MKSRTKLLLLLLALAVLAPRPMPAQITAEEQQSVVRIIKFGKSDENPALPAEDKVAFSNGDTYYNQAWGMGTGFVINKDGYVVTNNHVVARDSNLSDENNDIVLILQRVGDKFFLHRGTVEKQDPNADVAIVRVPTLKAMPLVFSPADPKESEDVFSIGFPASADVAIIRSDREARFASELFSWRMSDEQKKIWYPRFLQSWFDSFKQQNNRAPTQAELDVYKQKLPGLYENYWKNIYLLGLHYGYAELGDFFHDLIVKMKANPSASVWEVTDVLSQGERRNYISPTVTKGNAERIAEIPGWLSSAVEIPAIQHNLHIMHGNSGGPLLNGGGQIVGIVGRGSFGKLGDGVESTEALDWATTGKYITSLLQARHIAFILGQPWKPGAEIPKWLIVALSVAIAVAIASLVMVIIRGRRKTGITALVEALKAKGASGATQLLELVGAKSKVQNGASGRSRLLQNQPGGAWKLDGRTPTGKTFQIPISDIMFVSNRSRLVLGRSSELCDLVIEDETVSRQHAEIRRNGSGFLVADRNSANGTAVNGVFSRKPFTPVPFKPGDTLTIGEVKLNFGKS